MNLLLFCLFHFISLNLGEFGESFAFLSEEITSY